MHLASVSLIMINHTLLQNWSILFINLWIRLSIVFPGVNTVVPLVVLTDNNVDRYFVHILKLL